MADALTEHSTTADGMTADSTTAPDSTTADPTAADGSTTTDGTTDQLGARDVPVVAAPVIPPRKLNKTFRDMVFSVGLIAIVVLLFVGLNGGFTFAPGQPVASGPAPTANAVKQFSDAPRLLPFTPAVPKDLPSSWHANSSAITNPNSVDQGTPLTVRGGWLTPEGTFIALIATNAEPSALLRSEFKASAPDTGTVRAGDATWTQTTGVRTEAAWYRTSSSGITYLITGDADELSFRTMAASIAGA